MSLFFSSFLAATILPISSEFHFAYIATLKETQDITLALLVATMGNSLGGLSCYLLGRLGKWRWLERFFKISEESVLKYSKKLDSLGGWPALLCWLPVVGDPIAVYFGFMKASLLPFLIFMTIGKFIRYLFIALVV